MSDEDLCFTPASELRGQITRKEISPVEVTRAVLARIETLEPKLNAFATLTAESAMAAAKNAEDAIARGDDLGPLHGIPVTIKDLVATAGVPTEFGSHTRKGFVPEHDSPFVGRLRAAGAIELGKTTTSEYGWKGVSESPLTGITSNPWKLGYNAGASSAGAAAAAAAGYGPLHQGSDGAGSIRMPSHFSGVFGLKPTYGRVPAWPVNNNDQVSHMGPMTRTVLDAAMMLKIMAGPHSWDHTSLEAEPADYPARCADGIAGLKVAYSPDLGHARVDPEVAALVADAVRAFEDLGVTVEEVTPPFGPEGPEMVRFFWAAHILRYAEYLPEFGDRMDPGLVACLHSAERFTAEEYVNMRQRRLDYVYSMYRWFDDWDLLLTPAVSVAAFPADQLMPSHWPQHDWDWISWAEFSYPFNFSGSPAASVPCGFTNEGLPVGLQIVGKRFADLTVLQASAAFEAIRPWADKRPPIA